MILLGLPPEIAERRRDMLEHLNKVPFEEQNQLLAVYWQVAKNGDVTDSFCEDLKEITAAVKRVQLTQEAVGFHIPR